MRTASMSMFEIYIFVSVIGGILTLIFSIIAFIFAIKEGAEKSTIFSVLVALISAVIAILSYVNITVPIPTILPLNNETETYIDSVEITIKSDKSFLIKTYYTLDGTDPKNGELYKDIFSVSKSTTVCARNKFLWMWSEPEERPYIINKDNNEINSNDETYLDTISQQVLGQTKIENNDNTEEEFQVQQYPDDYTIFWEDEVFGKLMKKALHKEDITYGDVKNIKKMSISDEKIIVDEDEPFMYVKIEDRTQFITLSDLKYFPLLSSLTIYNFQSLNCDIFENSNCLANLNDLSIFTELQPYQIVQLTKLQKITSLSINYSNISMEDLKNISRIKNLDHLSLTCCNITDIHPIAKMTQLYYLNLSRNKISNIDALNNLSNLKEVILYDNKITDFSSVSHVEKVITIHEE